jgi:hypothetical protein
MKDKLYKKEILITVVFVVLFLLVGHSASIFVLFPNLQTGTFWGFPTQYILPVLLGWFGVAGVSFVMALVCNKFDDEMEEFVRQNEKENIGS